jgi:hypothetical protein
MKHFASILIILAVLGLGVSRAAAQVASSDLPAEAPRIEGDYSAAGAYSLMALFGILVLAGTFTNSHRNNVTEVRQ